MKRKQQYIAKDIYLGHGGLTIDGVHLPWLIGVEAAVESVADTLHEVSVTFFAEHVVAEPVASGDRVTFDGDQVVGYMDTTLESARKEAIAIVREGLADIRAWLGETEG